MPLLLGPVLDLILIAMLSRHRMVWLAAAVMAAGALALLGEPSGHAGPSSMELIGGSR